MIQLENDKVFVKLIALKSSVLLLDQAGRKLYDVKVTPAFRNKHFTDRGRMIEGYNFEMKEKSVVTGNPYDDGYIVIDKTEQNITRFGK